MAKENLEILIQTNANKEAKQVDVFSDSINNLSKRALKLATTFFSVKKAIDLSKYVINTAKEFEMLKSRLESLYDSAEIGTAVFERFKEVASTTPFQLQDIVEAGSQLKAFGQEATSQIKLIADLAAYMGVDMKVAAENFGRAMNNGLASSRVFRQRGISQMIMDFHSLSDVSAVTSDQIVEALEKITGGATQRMSQTFGGSLSNMKDAFSVLTSEIMESSLPVLTQFSQTITQILNDITLLVQGKDIDDFSKRMREMSFDELIRSRNEYNNLSKEQEEEEKKRKNDLIATNENYIDTLRKLKEEQKGLTDWTNFVNDWNEAIKAEEEYDKKLAEIKEKKENIKKESRENSKLEKQQIFYLKEQAKINKEKAEKIRKIIDEKIKEAYQNQIITQSQIDLNKIIQEQINLKEQLIETDEQIPDLMENIVKTSKEEVDVLQNIVDVSNVFTDGLSNAISNASMLIAQGRFEWESWKDLAVKSIQQVIAELIKMQLLFSIGNFFGLGSLSGGVNLLGGLFGSGTVTANPISTIAGGGLGALGGTISNATMPNINNNITPNFNIDVNLNPNAFINSADNRIFETKVRKAQNDTNRVAL